MSDTLLQGRIVWVEMLDPQGRNPKVRPAVVLTDTAEIRSDGVVVVVAVTSQVDSAPADLCVELPWHRDGHPRTKLNRRNVAVCNWLATIPATEIRSVGGQVPVGEMRRILAIMSGGDSAGSSPPPPTAAP